MDIKKKRLKIIVISVALALVIVSVAVFAGIKINTYNKGVKYLSDGEFRRAVTEFGKVSAIGFFKSKYVEEVKQAANILYEKLSSGEASYEEVMKSIKILDKIVEMDDTIDRFEMLDESIKNYNKGEEYKSSGEYVSAIESFSLIDKGDDFYKKAQDRISECTELLETRTRTKLEQYKRDKNYSEALALINNISPYLKRGSLDKYKQTFENQKSQIEQKQEQNEKLRAYEGKWISSSEELNQAVIELTVHKIDSALANFSMSFTDNSKKARTAFTKNVNGTVRGNVVSAEYKDNLGNRGRITLTLKDNSILVNAAQTYTSDKELSLACNGICYKD